MAYPRHRVLIEYEGDHHRTDAAQWASDLRRYRAAERLGWVVVRWSRSDLTRYLGEAIGHLRSVLTRRG